MIRIEQQLNKEPDDIRILKEGMLKAGDIAMNFWQKGTRAVVKTAKYDVTTEADRVVEEYLISWIRKHFPNFGIIGEESGGEVSNNLFTIDGIDGSAFFAAGLKEWAISLAQIRNGNVAIGMVYSPTLDELYYAKKRSGAYLNDERIYVSKETDIKAAIVNLGQDVVRIYNRSDIEKRFIKACRAHYTIGSSALAYGQLAAGKLHIAVHMGQPIWDIAPGIVLIEEAGGRVTSWNNTKEFALISKRVNNIIASNGILHARANRLIKDTIIQI